ncbi:hypothetical protein Pelo_4073 [Pelomyxa schiedti]|nr:hypothetical protein Pelo_4073 [Pelomyxa schiedti]
MATATGTTMLIDSGPALIMQAVDDRLVPFEQNIRVPVQIPRRKRGCIGHAGASPGVTLTTSTPPSRTTQLAAFDKVTTTPSTSPIWNPITP